MTSYDPEDGEYSYIDDVGITQEDNHRYEGLKGHRRIQQKPLQLTHPESSKPSNKCCRKPPCWGWVMLVIGLVIVAVLLTLLVFFLMSSAKPENKDIVTVETPSEGLPPSEIFTGTITPIESTTPSFASPVTFEDCQDAYNKGYRASGVYRIAPRGQVQMVVRCEQQLDSGGWTVIQRRINGYVSFNRNWANYKDGFGDLAADYWLGNDNIHVLTSGRGQKLKIEMIHPNTTLAYANYATFWIDSETQQYTLHVAGWKPSYPPGDSLIGHNGHGFSTLDRDVYSGINCGLTTPGGWWFTSCHPSNLNGLFHHGIKWTGIIWHPFTSPDESLLNVRMMVKKA